MSTIGGYKMEDGRFAAEDNVVVVPAAAKTATFTSDPVEVGGKGVLRLELNVTAASGTNPTLDVTLTTSKTRGGTYRTLGTFTQATATGTERKSFAGSDRWVKATATIAGTNPSFTFGISGEAV